MITGIAHVNITVPEGTFDQAEEFYGKTLGMTSVPVPALQKGMLTWFDITPGGQQVHVGFGPPNDESARHPCFRVDSEDALRSLQVKVYEHFERRDSGAPRAADKPDAENSDAQGPEYPQRFFARDYAGNRLEFSL